MPDSLKHKAISSVKWTAFETAARQVVQLALAVVLARLLTPEQLADVHLRVGGRALRWDGLDEDIWVTDAVLGRYPNSPIALAS